VDDASNTTAVAWYWASVGKHYSKIDHIGKEGVHQDGLTFCERRNIVGHLEIGRRLVETMQIYNGIMTESTASSHNPPERQRV
jgi:hypothetical protein